MAGTQTGQPPQEPPLTLVQHSEFLGSRIWTSVWSMSENFWLPNTPGASEAVPAIEVRFRYTSPVDGVVMNAVGVDVS